MDSYTERPNDTDILDAVFVSRPEDLSDLEDILPSLDDVLNPHADFASDSELPLWDSMLSTLSCPGMQSIDSQSMAQGLPAYGHGKGQDSNKAVAGPQAQLPSASNSACSCDAQQAIEWQTASQQGIESSPAQVHAQCPVQPQTGKSPDEPTSSRDSNPCAASPESASDKAAGSKKRKVDDSDEDCSGRHPSPSSGTTQGDKAAVQAGEEGDEEQKRMARMQRNRESAMLSRQRKKMQLDELERQNRQLQATNTHLTGLVAGLASENAALRQQLAMGGQPAPQPFAPPPVAPCAPRVMPMAQPHPYAPWQYPGMPYMSATPKVPIPQLKRNDVKKPAKAAGKKAKAAAGGTALLGLVTLLCLTGSIPSWPGSSPVPAQPNSHVMRSQTALPASVHAGGRVLQSIAEEAGYNDTAGWDAQERKPPAQPGQGALAAIPVKPSAKAVALQHLKDLAPITLNTDWGLEGGVSNVWRNVQGSGGRGGDLMPPMQCREVFRLDAAESSNSAAARRRLQNYLASLSSFRGRALMGPIAMPPTLRALPPPQAQDGNDRKGSKATIGCGEQEDDLIVSIMLPSPQTGDGEKDNKSFTSVDEVYVVAVRPAKEYVTYACSLQSPILV